MYAAPVGRVAYWVVNRFGQSVLRRVPVGVLSSARRTSQAWRAWGNRTAGVIGRTFGTAAAAGVGATMFVKKQSNAGKRRADARSRQTNARAAYLAQLRQRKATAGQAKSSARPAKRRGTRKAIGSRVFMKTRATLRRRKGRRVKPSLLVPYRIDRLQGVRQELPDDDPDASPVSLGYLTIGQGDGTVAGGTDAPIILTELTCFPNTAAPNPMQKVQIEDNGTIQFIPQLCQTSALTNITSQWQIEDSRYTTPNACPRAQVAWWDIRLKLYGCRKQPTTYTVSLVKFNRDYMAWEMRPPVGPEETQLNMFWQGMVRRLCVNTILPVNMDWKRMMTTIRSKTVHIEAGSADELDRNPTTVDLKWFIRDGKVRDYTEQGTAYATDGEVFSAAWNPRGSANTSSVPPAKDRVYLMIQATDMNPATATSDQDETPSFDFFIRRKLYQYGD